MSRARSSGADTALTEVAFDRAFAGLEQSDGILAAVSGGPDSTALMHTLAAWRERLVVAPPIEVATVDHGLRAESRQEAEAVAAAAERLGLPHHLLVWSDRRPGPASQAAARGARYRLLDDLMRRVGASDLVTAHTLDDQAETVLMRMAAGSGLGGLAGMRRVVDRAGGRHVRPFLDIPKGALVETCRVHGWSYVGDPSNADSRFARPRWRALMPELAAEGLDARRLARLAARLARADAALAEAARAALASVRLGPAEIDLGRLAAEPAETGLRALHTLLVESGADPARMRLDRLEACFEALAVASRAGLASRGTLSGLVLTLDRGGRLTVVAEPPRRRGRSASLTEIAAGAPHSLGNACLRA